MSIFKRKTTLKQPITDLPLSELLPAHFSILHELAVGKLTQSFMQSNSDTHKIQKNRLTKLIGMPAYYWVLLSQTLVILPHLTHMPVWLVVYGLFSIIMQLPRVKVIFAKKKKLKSTYKSIQLLAFLFGIVGIWVVYGNFGVESGVAFLLLCLMSKLWEMYQRRDAFIVLNLSLFVCAALFLLDQGLGSSLQAFIALLCVLMAFVSMNDDAQLSLETGFIIESSGAGRLKSVGVLAGFAIPLLVILFLFFPRLPPLWSMQMSNGQAETGMSDSMSPGDFANLSQSTELAFRVEFDGQRPSRPDMYWRGLVFSDFDGTTWRANNDRFNPWLENQKKPTWVAEAEQSSNQPEQKYQVILEPTNQLWLFSLDYPLQIAKDIGLTNEFTLATHQPVFQQRRYRSVYKENTKISLSLSSHERKINLQLPAIGNDKTRKLAQQLASQVDSEDAYITTIMEWINKGSFSYTLSPPRLTGDRIDQFLFETQSGFCEHYSSSFAFLLRAGGIPARVVVGYQGGKLARDGQSWEVRQMDAHAWTEVWLNGKGWVRIDPTSWIAPERIEMGMSAITSEQGADMFGDGAMAQFNYQQYKILQEFRRFTDQMSYYWDRDIVGFDQDKQSNSLFKWFKIKDVMQQIITMVSVFVIALTIFVLLMWWRRRQRWHMADKELMKLSQQLGTEDTQLERTDEEGMLAWLEKLEKNSQYMDYLSEIEQIKICYRALRYGRLSEIGINEKGKATPEYQKKLTRMNEQIRALANIQFKKKIKNNSF